MGTIAVVGATGTTGAVSPGLWQRRVRRCGRLPASRRPLVSTCAKHGVGHVVMHAAVRADRGDTGARILDSKTPIEQALAASGLGYTILRPAWFLQNLWMARGYVEAFPISPVHKDLYAELFDYFKATAYLGDPQPITDALPGFRISGVEEFLRHELFTRN